jgi:uncharacterized protein (TIGR03435 family)
MDGPDASRYVATNMPVKLLIELAYDMKDFQVSGGPGWIESERFDIDATIDDSTVEQWTKLPYLDQQARKYGMVRTLLAERFKLQIERVSKELPVYALLVAKDGPKLKQLPATDPANGVQAPPAAPGRGPLAAGTWRLSIYNGQITIEAKSEPISQLVDVLTRLNRRPVLDQTGLKGAYDFTLTYAEDAGPNATVSAPSALEPVSVDSGPLFTAIQQQLGLKLESSKAQVETIVIDHIEQPSPN